MTPASRLDRIMTQGIEDGVFPGGVVLIRHRGEVVFHEAYGHAVKYDDAQTLAASPIATRRDTVYDLASLTKLFTAARVMQLVDKGRLRLDDRVAEYLPGFAVNGKGAVTIQQLLTHTAGLPYIRLWEVAETPEARRRHVLEVTPEVPPGTAYVYHDTNFILLGMVIEAVAGRSLDRALATGLLELDPLGLDQVEFCPSHELRNTVAATEDAAHVGRGMVWGEVHDENAWSLGGVAGHAGLFGTAANIGFFGQVFLDIGLSGNGRSDTARSLSPETVAEMTRNQIGPLGKRGVGWQLDEPSYMGRLASPQTYGHTGFTGTSLIVDPRRDLVVVLLTNRVHPTRTGPDVYEVRRAVADAVADAMDDA